MASVFLYGTLQNMALLAAVLGHAVDGLGVHDDMLPDYTVLTGVQDGLPVLRSRPGDHAHGICVSGLTDEDIGRLDRYEACFSYAPRSHATRSGVLVRVYHPPGELETRERRWKLDDWSQRWGALAVLAAKEVLELAEAEPALLSNRELRRAMVRAQSRQNAARTEPSPGTLEGKVEILSHRRSYANFFALDDYRLRHERFDGTMSAPVERAVFVTSDAAVVLPYDPWRDEVLMVEQFRMGPLARGDRGKWLLEPVAGLIDPGESPEDTARRECQEEAGCEVVHLERIARAYPSPGGSSDFQHLFLAIADLRTSASTGGLDEEDEDIRVHIRPFADFMAMAAAQLLVCTPLLLAAYWLQVHRARLRSEHAGATD